MGSVYNVFLEGSMNIQYKYILYNGQCLTNGVVG